MLSLSRSQAKGIVLNMQRTAIVTQPTLRLFISVELPEAVRDSIGQAVRALQRSGVSGVRWVRPESVHLTLQFLGDTPENKMEAIAQAMGQAAQGVPPFELGVQGAGAFPNMRSPRVVWLGLNGQVETLRGLQAKVEQGLASLGFPHEERDFSPHLTLGRTSGRLPPNQLQPLAEGLEQLAMQSFPGIPVHALCLMESQLAPSGARYFRRRLVKLEGGVA